VTNTIFDNLVMTQTANGNQISGFVRGKTQARIVANRRGERIEIVCITENLTCAELGAVDALKGWQLVSAALEPYRPSEAFTAWR
jgi:hypothetical protein